MTTISQLPRVTSIGTQSLFLITENGVSKVVTWDFIKTNIVGFSGSTGQLGFTGSFGRGFTGSNGGYMGSIGRPGYTGSFGSGYIGSLGFTGSSGFTGSIGYAGSPGYTGYGGSIGYSGSLGYTGSLGYIGSKGDKGDPGGYTGSSGGKGDPGGYTGSSGIGYSGSKGFAGSMGYAGSVGTGYIGSRGATGYTGSGGGGGGGVGLAVRNSSLSVTTAVIAPNLTTTTQLTGYKAYALLKIATSSAAWVRVYTSSTARSNDSSRTQGNDPVPGNGVIAEVVTTGATSQTITPGAIGWNDDSPVSQTIYLSVTNLSGSTTGITVTLTAIQLEV